MITARPRRLLVLLGVALLASSSSCGGGGSGATTTATEPPPVDVPVTVDVLPEVAFAVADLADRLQIDEAEILVKGHEAVTWPDGSIGCPQPGLAYTQALVEGTQILLEVDGDIYAYHSAAEADPSYCENPEMPVGQS